MTKQTKLDYTEDFRALVEKQTDWIWEVDGEGLYTYVSPKVMDLLGYTVEEVLGKCAFDFMPEEEGERVGAIFAEICEKKEPFYNLNNVNLHKDGHEVVLQTSGIPIQDDKGNLLGYRGIDRDVTGCVFAEESLKERTELAELSASIGTMLAKAGTLKDALGKTVDLLITHLEGSFARIWVYDEKEQVLILRASAGLYTNIEGRHSRIGLGELTMGRIAAEGKALFTNDVRRDFRMDDNGWVEKNGIQSFAGVPLMVSDRVVGVLGLFSQKPYSDVTRTTLEGVADQIALGIDRLRVLEELSLSEYQYRTMIDSMDDHILVIDPDLRVVIWNESFASRCRDNGFEPEHKPMQEFMPFLEDRVMDEYRYVFSTGKKLISENPIVFEGVTYYAETRKIPIIEDGKVVRLIAVVRDITERKMDEKKLKSLALELSLTKDRERRQIASELHDNIAQSLAICRLKLQTLEANIEGEEQKQLIEQIASSLEHSIENTRESINRLGNPLLFKLGLVEALEYDLETYEKMHGIKTEMGGGDIPALNHDISTLLYYGVHELLANVVKHAKADSVHVAVGCDDGVVSVHVIDDGVGFGGKKEKREKFIGGGFGLYHLRERLRHVGGNIRVDSQPGEGTDVIMTVPLEMK